MTEGQNLTCLSSLFTDQMSASQILADLDMLPFDKESKVVPQIETMTENIYYGKKYRICHELTVEIKFHCTCLEKCY